MSGGLQTRFDLESILGVRWRQCRNVLWVMRGVTGDPTGVYRCPHKIPRRAELKQFWEEDSSMI